jgi:hypothetical protein
VFADGRLARRRSDSNGDGQSDTWTFYRGDEILRTEIDRDGDGFRDEVTTYQNGQVDREEVDNNGDGRPDAVSLYASGQISEKREDLDFDGRPDVVSRYKNGSSPAARRTPPRCSRCGTRTAPGDRDRGGAARGAFVRHRVRLGDLARDRAARGARGARGRAARTREPGSRAAQADRATALAGPRARRARACRGHGAAQLPVAREPRGREPAAARAGRGLSGFRLFAENIGATSVSGDRVRAIVDEWMRSHDHRENVLNPAFNTSGVGVAETGAGQTIIVELYATYPR